MFGIRFFRKFPFWASGHLFLPLFLRFPHLGRSRFAHFHSPPLPLIRENWTIGVWNGSFFRFDSPRVSSWGGGGCGCRSSWVFVGNKTIAKQDQQRPSENRVENATGWCSKWSSPTTIAKKGGDFLVPNDVYFLILSFVYMGFLICSCVWVWLFVVVSLGCGLGFGAW